MPTVEITAAVAAAAVLGMHLAQVASCRVPKDRACRKFDPWDSSAVGRSHMIILFAAMLFVPWALARNVSKSTMGLLLLGLCSVNGVFLAATGCWDKTVNTDGTARGLCRPNVSSLLSTAGSFVLLGLLLSVVVKHVTPTDAAYMGADYATSNDYYGK